MKELRSKGIQRTPVILERLFPRFLWGSHDRHSNRIYLTFDDGPSIAHTAAVIDTLHRLDAPATFFFRGDRILKYADWITVLKNEDICFGYHGFSHQSWWFRSRDGLREEMNPRRLGKIASRLEATGKVPLLLRPPYGRLGLNGIRYAAEMGAQLVFWRLVLGDWHSHHTEESLISGFLNHVRSGDIVVLHDGGVNGKIIPSVLNRVIPVLRDRGFTFGSLDELIVEFTK